MRRDLNEFNPLIGTGISMVLGYISSNVTESIIRRLFSSWVLPPIEKLRVKSRIGKAIREETLKALRDTAEAEGIPDRFVAAKAKAIAKKIIKSPSVKSTIRREAKVFIHGNDAEKERATHNISNVVSTEGKKEMKKEWKKSKRSVNESYGSRVLPRPILPVYMPHSLMGLLTPWQGDDFDSGVSFISSGGHNRGIAGSPPNIIRTFSNSSDEERAVIENRGRRLEINPQTREVYITDFGRRVYAGTLDGWNTERIRKLVLRYLGTVSDAMVNKFLRGLGLVESEESGPQMGLYYPRPTMKG